jgi:type II secretory pathway component PulF
MQRFDYEGFDSTGARVSGEIDASTAEEAMSQLKQRAVLVKALKVRQAEKASLLSGPVQPGLADLELLTAELSVLLDAGLKIDKGIEILRKTNQKPSMKVLLDKVSQSLQRGQQLSDALSQFGNVFDPLYINLLRIGETTGQLAEVFRRLARDLAFRRDLRSKIVQSVTYPLVILFVCISSVLFIFNFVVPNLAKMFNGQADLPIYTRMLLATSEWLIQYQLWLLGALVLGAVAISRGWRTPAVQDVVQRWQLKLPLLRTATVLVERIRFNSGLSMMLQSGVSIDVALELAIGNVRNQLIRQEVTIALSKIKRGEMLSAALKQSCLYPDLFASLLSIGEESGELARIFDEITQRSQREFSAWVTRLTTLLEPLMMLVMGGIVGSVVIIMMVSINATSTGGL